MCHPLLKLSLLNFVKLRLESEVQFGEHGVSVSAAFFGFEVIVVEYANDVFSKGVACAINKTFITAVKNIAISYKTIGSRCDVCIRGLIEVTYMQTIGTRFISSSALPSEVCIPAVFASTINIFVITAHIFSSKSKVRSEVVAYANVPDVFTFISISSKVCSISINCTHVSSYASNIETVFRIKKILKIIIVCTFSSHTEYLYFVAISKFHAINVSIKDVTSEGYFIPTACMYLYSTNTTINICTIQFNSIFCIFIGPSLSILEHTSVGPVFVNLAGYPQTGTESAFITVFIAVNIFVRETSLTGDFYVVSFFLKVSNANAEAVEFVSKFCCQFVYVSAFCHCFSNNLCHFITGHQFVAAVGAVGITVNYTSSCQFVYCVISPMTSRYIGEGVCGISAGSYAKSHSHCEN